MANQQQAIIIRKKKKGGHAGHHGGAWKVAYADFVTAMMSFFLLLWLLNTTTSDQRKGLADYFAPASIADSNSGSGGPMGGATLTVSTGGHVSATSPPVGQEDEVIPTVGAENDPGEGEGPKPGLGNSEAGDKAAGQVDKGQQAAGPGEVMKALSEAIAQEEGQFKGAEEALKAAIEGSPELSDFADQILVDRTAEGLRIQIVDKDRYSMFPSGSSILFERPRDLLRLVGKIVARLPNRVAITGHTDSAPFSIGSRRDNWSLSTERANTSRYEMVAAGVPDERIARVVGMADRDPLIANNPKDPKNRRISIVLLRQATPAGESH